VIGLTTLNIAISLIFGKFFGILCLTLVGIKVFRLSLPEGMKKRDVTLTSLICGAGLTVALFVAELAFEDDTLKGEAKLGALLSVIVAPVAIGIGRLVGAHKSAATVASPPKEPNTGIGFENSPNVNI
jgi:NhaA family Na+:H+ antiporter